MTLLLSGLRYTGTTTVAEYLNDLGFKVIILEDGLRLEPDNGARLLDIELGMIDVQGPLVKRIARDVRTESGGIVKGYMKGCLDFHSKLPGSTLIKITASSQDRWERYMKLEEDRRKSGENKSLSFPDFVSLYGLENHLLFSPSSSRVIIQNDRGLKELYGKVLDLQPYLTNRSSLTNERLRLVI